MLNRLYNDENGVLTFEWILLITVLVIGITGALSAVRDAMNTELGDVAEAMVALDQSYYICWPWDVSVPDTDGADGASNSYFLDGAYIYQERASADKKTVDGTGTSTGERLSQAVGALSSVKAEGSAEPNFKPST